MLGGELELRFGGFSWYLNGYSICFGVLVIDSLEVIGWENREEGRVWLLFREGEDLFEVI